MRRSTRIRWEIPVRISTVDSAAFSETCETVSVNAHGCGLISTTPLDRGTRVKLTGLPENGEASAHVADVVPLGEERSWLLGIQLERPANIWGVKDPPEDWKIAIADFQVSPAGNGANQSAPAAFAAAAATSPTNASRTPALSGSLTIVEPEAPELAIAPGLGFSQGAQRQADAAFTADREANPVLTEFELKMRQRASSLLQEFEQACRKLEGDKKSSGEPVRQLRGRDWEELRQQAQAQLKGVIAQLEAEMDVKVESWRQEMAASEAKLKTITQLQQDLQAKLDDFAQQAQKQAAHPDEPLADLLEPDQPSTSSAATTQALAAQAEEIKQLQQWMHSLVELVPKTMEQQVRDFGTAAEERLRSHTDEQVVRIEDQLRRFQGQLEDVASQQNQPKAPEPLPVLPQLSPEEVTRLKEQQALVSAQLEELKQTREWVQSVMQTLPQTVQQQVEKAAVAAQEALHGQADQEVARVQQALVQLGELKQTREWVQSVVQSLPQTVQQQVEKAAVAAQETLHGQADQEVARVQQALVQLGELKQTREWVQSVVQSLPQTVQQQVEKAAVAAQETLHGQADQEVARVQQAVVQLEELQQTREWVQSVVQSLPQTVQQQVAQAAAAAQESLHNHGDQEIARVQKEIAEFPEQLQGVLAQHEERWTANLEQRSQKVSQMVESKLQEIGNQTFGSVQQQLQSTVEGYQKQLEAARQTLNAEVTRVGHLAGDLTTKLNQLKLAREGLEMLISAPEAFDKRIEQGLAGALERLHKSAAAEIAIVKQAVINLQTRVQELQATQSQQPALDVEQATEDLKQRVDVMLREAGENVSSSLREQLRLHFESQRSELLSAKNSVESQVVELERRAAELSAQVAEVNRSRDSVASLVGALSQAANERLQDGATAALDRMHKRSEDEIGRINEASDRFKKNVDESLARGQRQFDEAVVRSQQQFDSSLQHRFQELQRASEGILREAGDQLCDAIRRKLQSDLEQQRQKAERASEELSAHVDRFEAHGQELTARWESKLEEYIGKAIVEVTERVHERLESAAAAAVNSKIAEMKARFERSLTPLVDRADAATVGLQQLLLSTQQQKQQFDARDGAFQKQVEEAKAWLNEETARFRQAVHDSLVEASGEIKGRIHMAVELTKEPIERRGREAQSEIEQLAANKGKELGQHFAELEKTIDPLLKERLAQALEKFQKDTEQTAETAIEKSQGELAEKLESMLDLLRKQAKHS